MTDAALPTDDARRQRRLVAVFVARALAVVAACWSVVGWLAAPLLPGGAATVALGFVLFTIVPLGVFIVTRARGWYAGAALRVLVFRPLWYAQAFALLLAPLGVAGALLGLPFGRAGAAGRAALLAGGAILAVACVAGYAGSRRLTLRRLVASLPDLPPALEGLRIAQISDLHVGPQTSRRFLARVLAAVRAAAPELVAVTGDLVDDFPGDVEHYAAGLGALAAPLGVYVIPGNHEVYSGWREMRPRLEALPVTLLVNRAVTVRRGGAPLTVAGTGDPAGGGDPAVAPDVARTLRDVPPGSFVLALAHNPALWPALAQRGVPLTLSGHTHWGQLGFPRLGWCLASPFLELAMGSHVRGASLLYIHPGTGYWGIPFRIGHSAEVAVIELRRGQRAEIRDSGVG